LIPERLFRILRSCESDDTSCFPATEVFNEGWMLRLVLDAMQTLDIPGHPLRFLSGSKWYSEARLRSPFRPRSEQDKHGEGFTKADGVIGHIDFRVTTKAGLKLTPRAKQFVVVEAKMFSNLSSGTKNAPGYDQAARNVACMADAIAWSGIPLSAFKSVGFFVVAPNLDARGHRDTNLETCLTPESIRKVVGQRIAAYETPLRQKEADTLREWETNHFLPLVHRLANEQRLAVLSWEQIIKTITVADPASGEELNSFYTHCRTFAPPTNQRVS